MTQSNASLRPAREVNQQMFLSPRVLDRTAYEEFAGALRALVDDACAQAQAVEAATIRAAQVHARLDQTGPVLEARISGAAHALSAAEARALEAQGLFGRATQRLAEAQAFEDHAVQRVQERLRAIELESERRAASTAADLSSQLDAADQRVHALQTRAVEISDRLGSLSREATATLDYVCGRSEALLNAATQAEQTRATLSQATTDALGAIEKAEAVREALRADMAILTERIYALQAGLAGPVRKARGLDARTIELKPTRRRRRPLVTKPRRRRSTRRAA